MKYLPPKAIGAIKKCLNLNLRVRRSVRCIGLPWRRVACYAPPPGKCRLLILQVRVWQAIIFRHVHKNKWIKGLDDLLDIGFHEDIRYHDFMVLPNAPAADPAYRKQYGIKTIWKNYYSSSRYDQANPPHQFKAEFISATNTMTENDMVEIQSYTSFLVGNSPQI